MASKTSRIVGIPNEVFIIIFVNLVCPDLKSIRLVCKLWSVFATERLFERIFISCRPKDLKVFRHITCHRDLQRVVETLVYDTKTSVEEADLSKWSYCRELIEQWRSVSHHVHRQNEYLMSRHNAIQASTLSIPDDENRRENPSDNFTYNVGAEDLESKGERLKDTMLFGHWHDKKK